MERLRSSYRTPERNSKNAFEYAFLTKGLEELDFDSVAYMRRNSELKFEYRCSFRCSLTRKKGARLESGPDFENLGP